jgi:hypothetical protein
MSLKAPNGVASPVSTGGGGARFENWVGAYYLAAVLMRSVARGGLPAAIAREVRFQRRYQGEPLDDLIIISDLLDGRTKIALQIKRDLTFGQDNQTFVDVLKACWQTFKSSSFNAGLDRFGVAIGVYSKKVDEHYQRVLTWARHSAQANDFISRLSQLGLTHADQRNFLTLIRNTLNGFLETPATDEEVWQFLRSMVILHFDFEAEGSRDKDYLVAALADVLPVERRQEASRVLTELVEYAAEADTTAGSFERAAILPRLVGAGIPLLAPPDCRRDLARLSEHTKFVVGDIGTTVGGITLDRVSLRTQAEERIGKSRLLEIVGLPGTGKSRPRQGNG